MTLYWPHEAPPYFYSVALQKLKTTYLELDKPTSAQSCTFNLYLISWKSFPDTSFCKLRRC